MSVDMSDIHLVLDGIREELSRIRMVLEQEAHNKSMILQKVNYEDSNAKLF